MRKIYLLITSALLLIGSNAWAAVASLTSGGTTVEYDTMDGTEGAMENWRTKGGTLKLLDNCTYNSPKAFFNNSTEEIIYELDFNGKTLTFNTHNNPSYGMKTYPNQTFTFKDSSVEKTGKLSFVRQGTSNTRFYGIYASGSYKGVGIVNVEDGVFEASRAGTTGITGTFYIETYGMLNIKNGVFDNIVSALNYDQKLLITGGKFKNVADNTYDKFDSFMPGKYLSLGSDGYFTLKEIDDADAVALVNGDKYRYFDIACKKSSEDNYAILQKDVTVSTSITSSAYVDLNGHNISGEDKIFFVTGGIVSIIGNGSVISSTTNVAIELDGYKWDDPNYSVFSIGKDVTIKALNGYGIGIFGKSASKNNAYGVVVNIDGNINASSGITINGNVNKTEGNVPVINIGDNAVITGGCGDNAAIYAAGYGIWNIGAATLNAATPIYAKSGVINIDGATIEACGAKAYPQPNNNGFYNTGDAIVMDTNKSYAGAVLLNIYGDATITSTNGYAIQEVITNGTTSSAAGIAISGDNTVLEGAAGSLQMTENFKDAMKDGSSETYQWVLNGIAGGVYSKVPGVVADGYVAQEVEIGGKKYYKVVVADPEAPAPASQTTYIVNDTEWDYSVEYKNSSALVITTGNTLKVKGVNVNRTSSEDVSKVTVEAGAKLIVGAEGIQTNSANGLLLKSDAVHGMGMLLYDGSTTATSPYGIAELYVSSKNLSGDERIWQHFGIPTQATPEIEKQVPASFNNWDVKKGWIWDGGSATLNAPWVGHNLSVNSDTPGQIIKFAGQLVGNEDAILALDKYGYNAFANSYTAPVNLKSIIDGAMEIDACTDGAVWMYSASEALETGVAQFHSYGAATSEDLAIDPMQAFFILHESNASDNITVSYEEAVLGYNTRAAVANDYNTATLKITGGGEADEFTIYEGEQFSSSIDKGYDIKQMNHDFIQIYAVQNGENYASVATDDAENLELTIKTKAATQYTLSFSGISEGYGVKLTDVKSGAEIEVGNDKTYTFTADANTTAVHFRFGKSEVSAEEANADAVKIWSANGSLFVEGNAAEADIEIINLSGVKVASAKASGEAVQAVSISNLASGVYVVRVGNTAAKIVK